MSKNDFLKASWKCRKEKIVFYEFPFLLYHYKLVVDDTSDDTCDTNNDETDDNTEITELLEEEAGGDNFTIK